MKKITKGEHSMSERSISYAPTFPNLFSRLCYSNALGIMRSPNFSIRNYKEENLVLIYTTVGCLFCEQEGREFTCEEGQYILLDKRITHSYRFDKSIRSEIVWMHINGELANDIAAQINALSKLAFIGTDKRVLDILLQCIDMQSGGAEHFEFSALISRVLHIILQEAYAEHQKVIYSPEEYEFRAKVEEILGSDELADITLDSLCAKMQMSKYYFSHKFKEYYGIPPLKHVQKLRLKKARYLLRYSDLKISAIAQKYGFSSHTYFSSAFRREFGTSPEQYRSKFYSNKH